MYAAGTAARSAQDAARSGDYTRAVAIAATMVTNMELQLERFRIQMERYDEACGAGDWRRAVRSLADARLAALAAGVPELEQVATERLYALVRKHEVTER